MIFDTHVHYDNEVFDKDRDEILSSLKRGGVGTVVNIGANLESSARAVRLAEQYPFVYAAVGVHPSETAKLKEKDIKLLKQLLEQPKVAAAGEIGLDYHEPEPSYKICEIQKYWFARQLELAAEKEMPVVIHSRDAAADTLMLIREYWEQAKVSGKSLTGVIHCFSYGTEIAKEYLKMGFWLGIGGVITFKNAKKIREVVAAAPLSQLVLETDCPYLAPEPYRGQRNSSTYLFHVAEAISTVKGIPTEEVIRVTEENAKRLYQMRDDSRLYRR